jgi:2-C-methyl-D-erythritol 4-phosphate cytidylyltransferase/2-C-methyl-D-erythritol 2,4-cyclodiphosphate synthase
MNFDVIIAAGGASARMGGLNKLALPMGEDFLLSRTIGCFEGFDNIKSIVLGIGEESDFLVEQILSNYPNLTIKVTQSGKTRTQTIENALKLCTAEGVLIHDGARPFVSKGLIFSVMQAVETHGAAVPAARVHDSVKIAKWEMGDGRWEPSGYVSGDADRNKFITVATPQGFLTETIKLAYENRNGQEFSDDSALYIDYIKNGSHLTPHISHPFIVENDPSNIKVTDLGTAFGLNSRVGIGFDMHNLIPLRKLVLGGVEIAADMGTVAHSDGDAVVHALMDALLTAVGERDIGVHFPNTDQKFFDADSSVLLYEVMQKVFNLNKRVINVSVVINLDKPKLNEYIPIMKVKLGNILKIPTHAIGISCKTTEGNLPSAVSAFAAVVLN